MLHPSYTDLMKLVNSEVESGEAPVVNSRYSIVLATSKRARQIIDGAESYVSPKCPKPLSIAIDELNNSKIRILSEEEAAEVEARKAAEAAARAEKEAKEALEKDETAETAEYGEEIPEGTASGALFRKREDKEGFVCTICGYIYEGITIPDGFICPICRNGEEVYDDAVEEEMADTVTATAETGMPEDILDVSAED